MAEASTVTPWLYKYQLPSDTGRILGVSVDDIPVDYERVGNLLHTMQDESVDLRYVKNYADVDDGVSFPEDFAEVLACFLAAELAVPMTQTQALRDTYLNMYVERLRSARFNGAVEQNRSPEVASSWLDAHDGYNASEIDVTRRGLSGY